MAAFIITKTESVLKQGNAGFVPFETEHTSFETSEGARAAFEGLYARYSRMAGDTDTNRDGSAFEVQVGPHAKVFVELTIVE